MLKTVIGFLIINITLTNSGVCQENMILVSPENCVKLTRHTPGADVKYKAGVDVRGKAVQPADMGNSPQFSASSSGAASVSFQLILDLGKEIDAELFDHHPGLRPEIVLGMISVKEGVATFNGHALTGSQDQALWLLCSENVKK